MSTSRTTWRQELGRALGRRYYVSAVTTGTSTINEIVDSKRTENRNEWDGASLYASTATAPNEAIVRGSADGRIFLDTDLGSIPASGAAYELFKGYTKGDYDAALDFGHRDSWPALYDALDDDTTITETIGTIKYALGLTWKRIAMVRREIKNSSPTRFYELQQGTDYELRRASTGIVYEALYDPDTTGLRLHFVGEKVPSLAAADASTSEIPIEVILPAALYWLYSKGANPDEASLAQRFDQEADRQAALSRAAKDAFRIPRQRTSARIPRITVTNDGSTQNGWTI